MTSHIPSEDFNESAGRDAPLNDDAPNDGAPEDYDSSKSAPLTRAERDDALQGMSGRDTWETGIENGDPTGNEVENGPDVDPNDPNLSATFADAGVGERADRLGLSEAGSDEFLDDPEAETEE